jgi:hypothetical protein
MMVSVAAIVGLDLMPSAANGQTVTYILSINDDGTSTYTPGDFAVYASDSTADGNHGIIAFSAELAGYDTIVNATPYITFEVYSTQTLPFPSGSLGGGGFCILRTPTNGASLSGSEDFNQQAYPASDRNPGFGQIAGNLGPPIIPFGGAVEVSASPVTAYSAPLLLGTGTFSDELPSWTPSANNFAELWVAPIDPTNTFEVGSGLFLDTQTLASVPEPHALAILLFGGMVLFARRRRRDKGSKAASPVFSGNFPSPIA